jgi:hypothetical protein
MKQMRWMLAVLLGVGMAACGLDGVTGQLMHIDGEWYRIRTMEGADLRVHVDERSRKDPVTVGDHVHLYVTKGGHAEFIQKVE